MQSADISELPGGVPGPFLADPHRRGTVPVLCPLWGCGRIVRRMAVARAIRLLWAALCLGGNRAGGEPTGICDCSAARSQIPYYNRVALGFPEIDPVGLCSSECRCAVAWDFAA